MSSNHAIKHIFLGVENFFFVEDNSIFIAMSLGHLRIIFILQYSRTFSTLWLLSKLCHLVVYFWYDIISTETCAVIFWYFKVSIFIFVEA
jgi:hypothetical protein